MDHLIGDVARIRASQKGDHRWDFVGGAETPQRQMEHHLLESIRSVRLVPDQAGRDGN
jgi:hypothetical protein